MKRCTRFHFADVERGDRLILEREEEPTIEVTVARAYNTHNFGPVVRGEDGEDYYLDDYHKVTEAK